MAQCDNGGGKGRLYLVGTGPGSAEYLTGAAARALEEAEIIVGYRTYLDLIPEYLEGKEVVSSRMRKEVDRCRTSLELAGEGKKVALVSGGDPGIYAMAGLALEMASGWENPPDIEVLPGIAALNACAGRLGAPLMHDFAAVSLSDLLTPWQVIEKRLQAASQADFVIVIYNPKSKKRTEHIVRAREIMLEYRDPQTPVGLVTAATRENERVVITSLADMLDQEIGMQTTVIIGNSMTYRWRDFMVTPRGYAGKYNL